MPQGIVYLHFQQVGTVTKLRVGQLRNPGSIPRKGKEIFIFFYIHGSVHRSMNQ